MHVGQSNLFHARAHLRLEAHWNGTKCWGNRVPSTVARLLTQL